VTNKSPSAHRPRKYLVVDDHAGFRHTVRDFLSGSPLEIIECGDGTQAAAAYAKNLPDWTLMDIELPVMDGLAATREIRRHFPSARIVILTQYDEADLRAEATRAGGWAYVPKDHLHQLPAILSGNQPSPISGQESGSMAPPPPESRRNRTADPRQQNGKRNESE